MRHALLLCFFVPLACAAVEPASVFFENGNIYTGNAKQPKAEAIAIRDDRIVFVGSGKDAQSYKGALSRTVDLKGATVLPGLTDAHCHILELASVS